MIWTLVTFGLCLYVLSKYVFPPVARAIENRRQEIAQSIDEAERSRDEALQLLDEYKQRLSEAQKEADVLRERGRKDGERRGAELVATRAGAARTRPRGPGHAARTPRPARPRRGFATASSTLRSPPPRRATRGALTDADHRRLIEEALDEADLSKLTKA